MSDFKGIPLDTSKRITELEWKLAEAEDKCTRIYTAGYLQGWDDCKAGRDAEHTRNVMLSALEQDHD